MDEAGQGIVFSSPPKCGVPVAHVGRSTNGTSLRPRWSVRSDVHIGEGTRLPAVRSGRRVPAIDSDTALSPLPVSGWVAHPAAGLR